LSSTSRPCDFEINEYNVTPDGVNYYDVRDLVTDQLFLPDQVEDDNELIRTQVLANNPDLLTYKDLSRLAAFRTVLGESFTHYSNAVTALAALSSEQIRQRYINAFNFDSTLAMELAKITRTYTLPQILDCLNGTRNDFMIARNEGTGNEYVDGEDGFYYNREDSDIYLDTVVTNPEVTGITLYSLLGSGEKTPRDVVIEAKAAEENGIDDDGDGFIDDEDEDGDYEPFSIDSTTRFMEGVSWIEWDDPMETFSIPLASITFDGAAYANSTQWNSITAFKTMGDTSLKLARNSSGDLFVCVKTTLATSSSSWWSWNTSLFLAMEYCGATNGPTSFTISTYAYRSQGNDAWHPNVIVRENNIGVPYEVKYFSDGSGYVIKISNKISVFSRMGSLNYYNLYHYANASGYNYYGWDDEDMKFLPEF
jgi:hypothetical protein